MKPTLIVKDDSDIDFKEVEMELNPDLKLEEMDDHRWNMQYTFTVTVEGEVNNDVKVPHNEYFNEVISSTEKFLKNLSGIRGSAKLTMADGYS